MKGKRLMEALAALLAVCIGCALVACGTETVTLTGIEVDAGAAKTEFAAGDPFSYEGLSVRAVYSDGTERAVTEYTVIPPDLSEEGEKEVTVTYTEGGITESGSYTVKVTAPEVHTLTGIEVDARQAKTNFTAGDPFSYEGLFVIAHYSDGDEENIPPEDCTFNTEELRMDVAGDKTVVVSYKGKEAQYTIHVSEKAVILQEITLTGYETEFIEGTAFRADGLTVTAHYSDGSSRPVALSQCTVTAPEKEQMTVGEHTVTVSYTENGVEAEESYTVHVRAKQITAIRVDAKDAVLRYAVGATVSHAGLVVMAVYDNGTQERLDGGFAYEDPETDTAGTKSVTVKLEEREEIRDSYEIEVVQKVLGGIVLGTEGVKTHFYTGDAFDSENLKVTAKYTEPALYPDAEVKRKDGNGEGYTVEPPDMDTANGKAAVIIRYAEGGVEKTASYEIRIEEAPAVKVLTGLKAEKGTAKTEFSYNEPFSAEGIKVTAQYSDGSEAVLREGTYEVAAPDMKRAGVQEVIIRYAEGGVEKTASYEITVAEPKIQSIAVRVTDAAKVRYAVGAAFKAEGIEVTAHREDGNGLTLTPPQYTVEEPDMSVAGKKQVKVTLRGNAEIFCMYEIEVVGKELARIELDDGNVKKEFFHGEPFECRGLIVRAVFRDSALYPDVLLQRKGDGVEDGYEVTVCGDWESAGSKTVKISYGGMEQSYTVEVKEDPHAFPEEISVTGGKVLYTEGETFETREMSVRVRMSDGSTREIGEGQKLHSEPHMRILGEQEVLFWYEKEGVRAETSVRICIVPKELRRSGGKLADGTQIVNVSEDGAEGAATLEIYVCDIRNGTDGGSYTCAWLLVRHADGNCDMGMFELYHDPSGETVCVNYNANFEINGVTEEGAWTENGPVFLVLKADPAHGHGEAMFMIDEGYWLENLLGQTEQGIAVDSGTAKKVYTLGETLDMRNVTVQTWETAEDFASGNFTDRTREMIESMEVAYRASASAEWEILEKGDGGYVLAREGLYTVTFTYRTATAFYRVAVLPAGFQCSETDHTLEGNERTLVFTDGDADGLALYITGREDGTQTGKMTVRGWFIVHTAMDGYVSNDSYEMYEFVAAYDEETASWTFTCGSARIGVDTDGGLQVYLNGRNYLAPADTLWQALLRGFL